MLRRNPVPASPRRGGALLTPEGLARLRRALVRRRGFPRGAQVEARAARAARAWFLDVDVRLASPDWIAGVAATPPRPPEGASPAETRGYLARLEALRPWAVVEAAEIAGAVSPGRRAQAPP